MTSPQLKIGSIFRGMLIHSLLGEGGMGAAWLASHPVLRTPMVLKTFKGTDPKVLFSEAHLAARVRSPFVVEPVDAGQYKGVAYLTQRYVDGIDLDELQEYAARLDWPTPAGVLARMMAEAARGLHAVHQAGVIHRDVKPANLFLRGDGVCCVGDFGIAVDSVDKVTAAGSSGTPLFMAPEQWGGDQVDRRTDLYALGATTHLMATGRPPFEASDAFGLAHAHMERPYERPEGRSPQDAYLFAVVDRAMSKDPEDRYPTAEAMAQALDVVASAPPEVRWSPNGGARIGSVEVLLTQGDITRIEADVIVNAANWAMAMRIGVAGALRRVGGESIEAEAVRCAPVPMGGVVWTEAGDLDARWIAHAVAALEGAICIQRCTLRALLGSEARRANHIVFPALGTGIGQVPMNLAAIMMLEALRTFASLEPRHVRTVRFVLFDEAAREVWGEVLGAM